MIRLSRKIRAGRAILISRGICGAQRNAATGQVLFALLMREAGNLFELFPILGFRDPADFFSLGFPPDAPRFRLETV